MCFSEMSGLVELCPFEVSFLIEARYSKGIFLIKLSVFEVGWSEPLRVDKKLSNANSWRKTYEEDEAAL